MQLLDENVSFSQSGKGKIYRRMARTVLLIFPFLQTTAFGGRGTVRAEQGIQATTRAIAPVNTDLTSVD